MTDDLDRAARELERDAALGRAVREALLTFAHPAYGTVGTLRGMAAILRKPAHGFDSTPALLDALADAVELDETARLAPAPARDECCADCGAPFGAPCGRDDEYRCAGLSGDPMNELGELSDEELEVAVRIAAHHGGLPYAEAAVAELVGRAYRRGTDAGVRMMIDDSKDAPARDEANRDDMDDTRLYEADVVYRSDGTTTCSQLRRVPLRDDADGGGVCAECEGCGQVADTDEGGPWTNWTSLPPGSDVAVRLGLVKPKPCPSCAAPAGDGGEP